MVVAFLPAAGQALSTKIAEELRERVASEHFMREGIIVRVTVSIGLASYPARGTSAKELFEAADRALYRAKALGKNQVVS